MNNVSDLMSKLQGCIAEMDEIITLFPWWYKMGNDDMKLLTGFRFRIDEYIKYQVNANQT